MGEMLQKDNGAGEFVHKYLSLLGKEYEEKEPEAKGSLIKEPCTECVHKRNRTCEGAEKGKEGARIHTRLHTLTSHKHSKGNAGLTDHSLNCKNWLLWLRRAVKHMETGIVFPLLGFFPFPLLLRAPCPISPLAKCLMSSAPVLPDVAPPGPTDWGLRNKAPVD